MQLAIELPDELVEKVMRQGNVSQFVQEFIRKILLDAYKIDNTDVPLFFENQKRAPTPSHALW